MFHLTKQEKIVICILGLVILTGSAIRYAFKKYPSLADMVNLIDSNAIYYKVNVNTASQEELVGIPYIGEYTSQNIIEYRQKHGDFLTLDDLKKVKGIRIKNFDRFVPYMKVRP